MPKGDGTGPKGKGPKVDKGKAPVNSTEKANRPQGRGKKRGGKGGGRGRGAGQGRDNRR